MSVSKRLQNSIDRIKNCGGVILVHHTPTSVEYQLTNGREVSPEVIKKLSERQMLESGKDGLFGGDEQTMHLVIA